MTRVTHFKAVHKFQIFYLQFWEYCIICTLLESLHNSFCLVFVYKNYGTRKQWKKIESKVSKCDTGYVVTRVTWLDNQMNINTPIYLQFVYIGIFHSKYNTLLLYLLVSLSHVSKNIIWRWKCNRYTCHMSMVKKMSQHYPCHIDQYG